MADEHKNIHEIWISHREAAPISWKPFAAGLSGFDLARSIDFNAPPPTPPSQGFWRDWEWISDAAPHHLIRGASWLSGTLLVAVWPELTQNGAVNRWVLGLELTAATTGELTAVMSRPLACVFGYVDPAPYGGLDDVKAVATWAAGVRLRELADRALAETHPAPAAE